jgi:hypothetical protein
VQTCADSYCQAKALEMFLGVLVCEASNVAHQRKAKRVEAYHLCVSSLLTQLLRV